MTLVFFPAGREPIRWFFFQQNRKGKKNRPKENARCEKKVEKIMLSQVILMVQKIDGHEFQKVFGYPFKKKSF